MDSSLMREKVAADLFQEFDVPAAATSFCVVYVDYGEGSQYYGVYTMVEEMDDTGIFEQFAEDQGNLYKPDGDAASFSIGTYDKEEFEKKNNEEEADYSDVEALYEIINSNLRITDSNSWKTTLENVFNVDGFMRYLAVNTVIQNWDTYGNMTHNYYLYQDLETGQLNWIPWDNNEAFSSGKGNRSALSLDMEEVSDHWPLIRYLLEEPEYKALYEAYLQEFVEEVFTMENMVETYDTYYDLIKEYAYAEEDGYTFLSSEKAFDQAVTTLKTHVEKRIEAVESYLEK
jgi:spore coat protein CotH